MTEHMPLTAEERQDIHMRHTTWLYAVAREKETFWEKYCIRAVADLEAAEKRANSALVGAEMIAQQGEAAIERAEAAEKQNERLRRLVRAQEPYCPAERPKSNYPVSIESGPRLIQTDAIWDEYEAARKETGLF